MDAVFDTLAKTWGKLDFLVHAISFSDKTQLRGRYVDTTADNFRMTMDISCFSLTALSKRAEPLMTDGGSIVTLTYYGAEKVMPHYNVMGVAKAALEASVRYLALEKLRIAPKGSVNVSTFLKKGADALVAGGKTGTYTTMYLTVARKPLSKSELKAELKRAASTPRKR